MPNHAAAALAAAKPQPDPCPPSISTRRSKRRSSASSIAAAASMRTSPRLAPPANGRSTASPPGCSASGTASPGRRGTWDGAGGRPARSRTAIDLPTSAIRWSRACSCVSTTTTSSSHGVRRPWCERRLRLHQSVRGLGADRRRVGRHPAHAPLPPPAHAAGPTDCRVGGMAALPWRRDLWLAAGRAVRRSPGSAILIARSPTL